MSTACTNWTDEVKISVAFRTERGFNVGVRKPEQVEPADSSRMELRSHMKNTVKFELTQEEAEAFMRSFRLPLTYTSEDRAGKPCDQVVVFVQDRELMAKAATRMAKAKTAKPSAEKMFFAFNKATGMWWDGKFGFTLGSRDTDCGRETKIPQSAVAFMRMAWNNVEFVPAN